MLSVKRAILDRRLLEPIIRVVQTETLNEFGEPQISRFYSNEMAVVTMPKESTLLRLRDASTYQQYILVTSSLIFLPDNLTGQPDIIIWNGNEYLVTSVDDYQNRGYTRATCGLLGLHVSVPLIEDNYSE